MLVIKLCSTTAGTPTVTPDIASVMVYLDDGAALNNGFMCPGGEYNLAYCVLHTCATEFTNN